MDDFSLNIVIEREPAVVFAFVADPSNMPQWYEAVERVTVAADAPLGRGTTLELVRSLPGGPAVNVVEITEYEPNTLVTFESRQGPTPFRYRYTFEPTAGGTVLTLEGRISSEGLHGPAAHLGGVATKLFARGMKRNLEVLRSVIESAPAR
jgi:uncharacterized protein YndB with AHSA1/START domain